MMIRDTQFYTLSIVNYILDEFVRYYTFLKRTGITECYSYCILQKRDGEVSVSLRGDDVSQM